VVVSWGMDVVREMMAESKVEAMPLAVALP